MEKIYVLQKDWASPFFNYSKGTEFVHKESTKYFSPADGRNFVIRQEDILSKPDWFKEKKQELVTGLIGVTIKGNVLPYENTASININPDGTIKALALDGRIFLPEQQVDDIPKNCPCCGGEQVYIRGRYPNSDKRKVCPTCATERLEQINQILSEMTSVSCQSN